MNSTPANERSRASTLSTSQPQPPANLSKEDAADWLAIDQALSHIQSVNPSDPYVLTIPQDVEPRYHHPNTVQQRQWLDHTPFTDREHEASQYLTWHFHEPGDMYVMHSTRPREERQEAGSRVSTPKPGSGGAKKVMSLGAYKKKAAGGTPGPEERVKAEVNGEKNEGAEERKREGEKSVKKPAVKGPVERIKADEEVLAAVEEGEDILLAAAEKKKDDSKRDLKRKREDEKTEESKAAKRKREDSKISGDREEKKAEDAAKPAVGHTKQEKTVLPSSNPDETTKAARADQPPPPNSESRQSPAKRANMPTSQDAPAEPQTDNKATGQAPLTFEHPKSPEKQPSSPPKPSQEVSDMALPPRLSPLREDSSKDAGEDDSLLLPPRLSPTLPANITATLAARKHYRSTSKSSAAGDNLTPPRKTLENSVARRKSPVNGFRANSSSPMVRSDAEEVRGRTKTSAPRVRSPSPSGEESEIAVGRAAAPSKKESKPTCIVKLKFKQKGTRDSLKQLLKLPAAKKKLDPKPSPTALKATEARQTQSKPSPTPLKPTDARHREQRDANAKGVAQKIGPATKGVMRKVEKSATSTPVPSEKRTRDEESEADDRPSKRKKADIAVYEPPGKRKKPPPESLDLKKTTPPTPSQRPQQPPTPASSVQKPASAPPPTVTAPKKSGNELLTAATTSASMKREASHDSQGQIATPSASSSSPAASGPSQPPSSAVPKSTPTTSSTPAPAQTKTPRQKEWEAQQMMYDNLGRELKRAAAADVSASERNSTPAETETLRRLAAIKTLESLLAYFISFISNDEASLAAEPKMQLRTRPWWSLKDYFPFVKNNMKPFPALQGLACTLAVVFCARIMEICVETGNKEVLSQSWGLLTRSAADAEGKLDVRKLQEVFPKAWAESVSGNGAVEEEKLEPGRFGGSYKLPLGVQTKPVRAVRAAYAMLREWIEKEGVGYEMRLKLDQA